MDGTFRMEKIPIGRISIQLSYLGYEAKTISDIIVNSGKEVVLDLSMQESVVNMNEVVVSANKKGEATNEMAMISSRSISPEETKRYTGGMDDPARVYGRESEVLSNWRLLMFFPKALTNYIINA